MFFILDIDLALTAVGSDQRMQFAMVSENGVEKNKALSFRTPLNMMRTTGYILYIMKKYTRKCLSGERRTKRVR